MPWQPLPRIAFAVATYPFIASTPADLPLEIGDELYIIEETPDGNWLRGYLVAPPSLLAGLTSAKGQTLEARVFSGIFPRSCVEVRELLGEPDDDENASEGDAKPGGNRRSDSAKSGLSPLTERARRKAGDKHVSVDSKLAGPRISYTQTHRKPLKELPNGTNGATLSVPVRRDPNSPPPPAPVPMLKIGDETPTSAAEPLIDEIASCLREWHSTNLHVLLLTRQYSKLEKLSHLINSLYFARQQFLHNVLTAHEYERLREKTVWDLVKVNKLCGGEVIVRDPAQRGRVLTCDDAIVETTKLQTTMSLLDEPPQPAVELTALHHLLVDVKGFAGASADETTLDLYLIAKPLGQPAAALSETFSVNVPSGGFIGSNVIDGKMKTLFTDLSAQDIGDIPSAETDLYLVVKVRATQQIAASPNPLSRSGTGGQTPFSRDYAKPPVSSANKQSSRRSIMWNKGSRAAFSRGATTPKLDAVSEQPAGRPPTNGGLESRDGSLPPSTAGSKSQNGGQPATFSAKRTVGVGILRLNTIMKREEEVEQVISILTSSTRVSQEKPEGGDEWDALIREVMGGKPGQYAPSARAERLQVVLKGFNNLDADTLIRSTPTLLSGVRKTNKIGFTGAPTKPRSDIYVTIDGASLARHNLLSRYGGSPTVIPTSVQGTNLQVTLEVRRASGERVESCVFPWSNADSVTTCRSVAVERDEPWKQTIRLSIPPSDVQDSHIVMFVSDIPNPPFAVAHIPLWDKVAFRPDGLHYPLLYKVDENTSTAQAGPSGRGGYLSLPWSGRGKGDAVEVTGPIAALRVETYLCSTQFSQDKAVIGLLKWKDSRDDIPAILKQLIFVPEIEIVKLLHDVLDALFAVLVEYSGNAEYEDLVFTALVRVLGIVHDRRFNLGPLVDTYAETKFSYPFATPCLVQSFTRLLEKPTEPETARKLRATFKVVKHLLKFITRARGQQKAKEAHLGITATNPGFTRHIRTVFKALDAMMRNFAPVLVGSQTLAVQHFHTWLPELAGLLTTEEILHIAIDFMDSCAGVKGKLVLYKLILVINYSKLEIFSQPEQRSALSANTVRWIAPHWGHTGEVTDLWRDQVRLCCSVVASHLDYIGNEIPDYIPKIIESYLVIQATPRKPKTRLSLLFPTAYPFATKILPEPIFFDEALIELSAVLSALSNSAAGGMQLELADVELTLLLEQALRVYMSILSGEAFPAEWLSIHIYHHKSTMHTLQYLADIMLESFLPDPDEAENFNTELWKLFFSTLLKLVGSSSLALETFPEQKRRAVWKIAGDVREHGAELLRRTWEAIGWETTAEERAQYHLAKIGGYQVQYVPTLVGPIVELCLSVHEGLRTMAVEVLQTMIVSEWTLGEDLSVIQTEMIDCLDRFFKTKPMTESILQKLFVGELLDRFEILERAPNDALSTSTKELMATIDEFIDLLVAVRSGDGTSEATHLINRLRLMEFLRDMQKEEIFIRYVHQLAALQSESRNHAEAGLALRLHADLYDWDSSKHTPALTDPDFPMQSHFERKERIYFDMITHFEEGEAWTSALETYRELQVQYETNVFDFAKLARTERAIAKIYETIVKSDKLVPKYYKVIYKGLGFPTSLRDKEYVYEGTPGERTSAFTDRMQEQYPAAQIVTHGDVDEVEGQYLVISSITPHRDLSHHVFQRARVQYGIRDYILSAHPQEFSVSTRRNTSGPATEHYADKLVYTVAEPFPTILRRSEIIGTHEVKLSARETALERITRKTQEIGTLERRVVEGDLETARVLFDIVAASVNPTAENSIVGYRQFIPSAETEDDEAELDALDNSIKMALVDHAFIIRKCLATFAKSPIDTLSRNHEELYRYFEITFAPEIELFMIPQATQDLASPAGMWHPSPISEKTPVTSLVAAVSQDASEASVIQPVKPGRGARMSFLGGKKKDVVRSSEEQQRDRMRSTTQSSANTDSGLSRARSGAGNGVANGRRGVFRQQSEAPPPSYQGTANGDAGGEWVTDSNTGQESLEIGDKDGNKGVGIHKMGSVRKRLSMLKIGKRGGGKGDRAVMGSLDEE
ncbi:related to dock180 protein [Cephalotrichum gorgonifer]|uniref:Related to dock180 protein n=1 Tax=Cephalotrichum gorgonifer TaxID=2041049 RepID=A0AAE8MZ42_9PEZI|nr:related to dock180 protein [Cephalotrichum gorgonifer]